jgi:8-oxo-dGTP pyrophosphatase MutT (NUDIX family)
MPLNLGMCKSHRMKREESVGCVMIYKHFKEHAGKRNTKEDLFLLMQSYSGLWNFVKGHRERDELDEETLRREVYEETGITTFKIIGFIDKIKYRFPAKAGHIVSKEVSFYLALSDTNEVTLSREHTNFRWAEYTEALRLLTFEQSISILKKAAKMRKVLAAAA